MKLSMRWLSDFYKLERDTQQYVDDITMSGTKVEGYERENTNIKNVVVGRILSVVPHPNADSLVICQVDVGEKQVQIVTGADNVEENDLVPVALHKSLLPNGTKITRGKLRGEASEGMLCSLEELNLDVGDFPYAVEDGIFILEEDCLPGESIDSAIGLDDTIVEFEITSNRPDCLSVIGLARETAATYGDKLIIPEVKVKGGGRKIQDILSLEVENKVLCKRYMAAAVEGVKIEPSPRWIRERLRASGVRPINNIVDITNFVMLEYGHPMHAFDLRHVEGERIVVRNARAGETITTLDGEARELSEEMLVIADEKSPSAVAGVMGGEYSGVYDDTTTVIFESACFDGASVRRTAKKLGMRTESSGRFEKGLDSRNCEQALLRACQLVEELGAGVVAKGVLDSDNDQQKPLVLPFEPDWINKFIGVDIPREAMEKILYDLDFTVKGDLVEAPSFRRGDMEVRNDIAEEVARIYGYNKIPTTSPRGESRGIVSKSQKFEVRIAKVLEAQGYSEIKTYSFFSPKNYDKIALSKDSPLRNYVSIRNPLGEDTSVMRTTLIPSMLMTLAYNYNNRNPEGRLYEVAARYLPTKEGQLPEEPKTVVLGAYGEETDFFSLKGGIEALFERLGLERVNWRLETGNPTFHPGRCANIYLGDLLIGVAGEVHPSVVDNYDMGTRAYVAELDYSVLFAARQKEIIHKSLPKFPASTRDLALVADLKLPVGELEKVIRAEAGALLEKLELFDVYTGSQLDKNKKSVAYALVLRGGDRTLTDKECDGVVEKILTALRKIDVRIRE